MANGKWRHVVWTAWVRGWMGNILDIQGVHWALQSYGRLSQPESTSEIRPSQKRHVRHSKCWLQPKASRLNMTKCILAHKSEKPKDTLRAWRSVLPLYLSWGDHLSFISLSMHPQQLVGKKSGRREDLWEIGDSEHFYLETEKYLNSLFILWYCTETTPAFNAAQ